MPHTGRSTVASCGTLMASGTAGWSWDGQIMRIFTPSTGEFGVNLLNSSQLNFLDAFLTATFTDASLGPQRTDCRSVSTSGDWREFEFQVIKEFFKFFFFTLELTQAIGTYDQSPSLPPSLSPTLPRMLECFGCGYGLFKGKSIMCSYSCHLTGLKTDHSN